MKRFALSLLVAAIFAPLTGCIVRDHDRVVERRPAVYHEEYREEARPVIIDRSRDRDDRGIRVDVHP